ncbi:methyltransferase domain-containing protein [Bradyrhizobium sp.]|jgi:SAM-dependent methyltransferase|uniref:class I SAM-dependent methyltransferase n=1 Tax=Bradyrhizobium sp. TaxID=376 RepID=UPI003C181BE7
MTETASLPSPQCRLCGAVIGTHLLSLGRIPVCNDFKNGETSDRLVNLDIVECETCQLIQLRETPPIDALAPRLPWIRYREPEGHLDSVTDAVLELRPQARRALGTGPFEQPLLTRLSARGLSTAALELDAASAQGRYPYLETWQAGLNPQRLAARAAQLGTFDLVSSRYIVEHTQAPVHALEALKHLLSPDGLLLIEVPDSSRFLAARDYGFLWEEHSCYFVEDSLRRLAETAGFRVRKLLRYPGALEDALVAILQVTDTPASETTGRISGSSILFQAYRDHFGPTRTLLRKRLAAAEGRYRDGIALFGIGHHAIMFANAFDVADMIALAVDDDPDKAGFFPPGFRVPVVGSQALFENARITTCLFAVAPYMQAKVQARLAPLAARGVKFRSIYAALEDSIMKDLA